MLVMNRSFGSRLRELRDAMGVTPGQLAAQVGISENAIRQMELGYTKSASFAVGVRLAAALGVTPAYLAMGEDVEERAPAADLSLRVSGLEARQRRSIQLVLRLFRALGTQIKVDPTLETLLKTLDAIAQERDGG